MASSLTCPYCLSPIAVDEAVRVCDSCGTAHHSECWEENGGCCVRSCKKVSRQIELEIEGDAPEKLVLTREAVESVKTRVSAAERNPCLKCGRNLPAGELYCENCAPTREENQDPRNLGPLLIMLGIAGLVLLLLALLFINLEPDSSKETGAPGVGVKVRR